MFKLIPQPGRILIQEDSFAYSGKLIIPEAAKRRPSIGTVIAIGTSSTPLELKVGDRVLFAMYSGVGVRFRDAKTQEGLPPMRVLTPEEVQCIVEGDAELEEAGA